jgi:ABC-type multidrug transport system fused ATPase/permease subunit
VLKKLINKYFKHFVYFYSYLRNRIFIALILSIIVGLLDSVGLVFFLPLLGITESSGSVGSSENFFGGFHFLNNWLDTLGVKMSLGSILLVIFFIFLLKNIIRFIEGVYSTNNQRNFVVKIRKEYNRLFRDYKYSAYTTSDSGMIQSTFTVGVSNVVSGYKSYFMTLQSAILVLVYLVMAYLANFKFAALMTVGGLLTNFIFSFMYRQSKVISRKLTKNSHGFQGLLIQSVAFFKYLKATGKITTYSKRVEHLIDAGEKYTRQMGMINTFLISVREPVVLAILLLVIYLQVAIIGQSMVSILISVMLFYRALSVLMILQTNWNSFMQSTGALENLQDFKRELLSEKEQYGTFKLTEFQKNLQLSNVSFKYASGDIILKDINLTISKNKTVAFVGESGSGKTTIVNLIAGLLEPVSGLYTIDAKDSKQMDLRSFQSRIGYITQEAIVFDDTIFNNITFWDEPTPENIEKFWSSLKGAAISDFVNELSEKENTRLGNNGVMISGGQKQRMSIARELYKEIDILIMDEATSALDSETEKAIQENIDKLKGKYTIIIVAHRLSTIKNADQIVLMDKGCLVEVGDFETLKAKNAYFNKMVSLQEI